MMMMRTRRNMRSRCCCCIPFPFWCLLSKGEWKWSFMHRSSCIHFIYIPRLYLCKTMWHENLTCNISLSVLELYWTYVIKDLC
jgi:hypothetical protein